MSGSVGKRTWVKCWKCLPWFIRDGSSSPWLVQMREFSARGSSAGPWGWISVSWSCAGSSSALPGKPSSGPELSVPGCRFSSLKFIHVSFFLQRTALQGPQMGFSSLSPEQKLKATLFSRFPWDFSSFSAWGIKPVIWNLHPYYLLPSPSICTVSKSPGQRCHYAQSLPIQVQSGDLTMLIKGLMKNKK